MLISKINTSEEDTRLCCPNCGCTELYYEVGMKLGRLYHCKRCGYIGTFVSEANQELRQIIQNGIAKKIDENPFTAKEYIPFKRKILYASIVMSAISYAFVYVFPKYSTTLGLALFFLYLLFILFTYFKNK